MKKETPILFNTEMVNALLDGRKTMTRREVKNKNPLTCLNNPSVKGIEGISSICTYGKVGDLLYVREKMIFNKNSKTYWPVADGYRKTADYEKIVPSIHVPKAAARIWLEVTDVRVERLQEISNEDCVKEGVLFIENETSFGYKLYGNHHVSDIFGRKAATGTEFESFQTLFQHINGPESWDANPWVWVISFKVVSKTGKL